MKKVLLFITVFVLWYQSNAQDTVRIEKVRVDTVKIETVKTDTVYIQPSNNVQPIQQTQTSPLQTAQPLINPSKLYFGGYVNIAFGSYSVMGIEPMVGYKLTRKLSFGAKISYEYINDKRYNEVYTASNYGFSLFNRFRVTNRFYTHAEFSEMNYKLYNNVGGSSRDWVPFLLLGGGLSQPISKNTWMTAEVLFDVLQNENSPYKGWEPFINIGFGAGF